MVQEAFRFECIRVWISFGIKVDRPPTDHNDGAFRDEVSLVFVVFCEHVELAGLGDGSITHDLFDDGSRVRKVRFVVPRWRTRFSDDLVDLSLRFRDNFRM